MQDQLDAFHANWGKVDLSYARKKNLTPYDVLIIASLVEKEALAPDERPKIARVIYNRLHAHMNLGIDATTRYGLHVPGTKSLTQSELASYNPYNTRNPNILGLPPTPIANPGLASMQAAAHPAPGNWLYFVRKRDKVHHYFTDNYNDFLNHERRVRLLSSSRCSAIRSRTRSRRGCRTRRSLRAGSTGPMSRSTCRRSGSRRRCAGSRRSGSSARTSRRRTRWRWRGSSAASCRR